MGAVVIDKPLPSHTIDQDFANEIQFAQVRITFATQYTQDAR